MSQGKKKSPLKRVEIAVRQNVKALLKRMPKRWYQWAESVYIAEESVRIAVIKLFTKIDPNAVVMITFSGNYECNPKGITEELLRRDAPYKITWGMQRPEKQGIYLSDFPTDPRVTCCAKRSTEFYKALASAHVIVDNAVTTAFLGYKKRKGQVMIQTWHGAMGIKKLSSANADPHWGKRMHNEAAMTDYLISNSAFEDDIYRGSYSTTVPILRYGHARNDVLYGFDRARRERIRKAVWDTFHLPEDAKLCLYAPTFRDDRDMSPYSIDYGTLRDALSERFGGNWVIMARFHYKLRDFFKTAKLPEFVVNASIYPDIQDLLVFTDCGITDYSSWICEYALTRRPGFLFATDLKHYEGEERGFAYPLSELPFPLAADNETLIQNIRAFDETKFASDCERFMELRGAADDGHAAERIADKIDEILKQKV